MATVQHAFFSWVSSAGNDMAPGDVHGWWLAPTFYGEAISLTAQPVVGNPADPSRTLAIENVRLVGEPNGDRTLLFNVRNAGGSFIPAYGIGFGFIQA
jgi:hypothetical protein